MRTTSHSQSLFRPHCLVVIVVAAGCLGSLPCRAQTPAAASAEVALDDQGYKVLVPIASLASNKGAEAQARSRIRAYLMSPGNDLQDYQLYIESYFVRFLFPTFTQTTPEALKTLPDRRNAFFRTELEICANPVEHAFLVSLTLGQMSAIVQDSFHPVVRYNAMLIISSLNDQETVRVGADKRVPEPMARALPFILAQFQKPDRDDIKVAALIGLSRHLEWEPHRAAGSAPIPAPLRTQIINELLMIVQAKDPPPERSAEGHLWIRRRAAEALGFACYSKVEPPVADALDQILKDGSEPLSLRCTVATALGRMNFQAPAKLDTVATTKELGYLALVACDAELNRIKTLRETETERAARLSGQIQSSTGGGEFGDPMGAGPGGGLPMPGVGPGGGPAGGAGLGGAGVGGEFGGLGGGLGGGAASVSQDPKGYRFEYVRRRIRQQLYCVQFALTGGDEFDPKRTTPLGATPGTQEVKMPPRGMNAFAKAGDEKKYVADVYGKVRDLANVCESKAVDLAMLDKELRKTMKSLEAITKKLAPPAAPATVTPAAPPAAGIPAEPPAAAPMPPAAPPAAAPPAASPPASAPPAAPAPATPKSPPPAAPPPAAAP